MLVDRVDEPYLINGSTELMRALVWPMLDNKFLKHPGLGAETVAADRTGAAVGPRGPRFPSAGPLGQAEPDSLAGAGPANRCTIWPTPACGLCGRGSVAVVRRFFRQEVDVRRLKDAFTTLRVPRHLFKFMYRLFTAHCNAHSDDAAGLADFQRRVRVGLGALPARSGGVRSRRGGGVRRE